MRSMRKHQGKILLKYMCRCSFLSLISHGSLFVVFDAGKRYIIYLSLYIYIYI